MRKITQKWAFLFMTLLCLVGMSNVVMAQTCVEIGDGTTAGSGSLPVASWYHYSYTQQLFTADEIGQGAGNIVSIGFQYDNTSSMTRKISIFMANTDEESLTTAFFSDGLTEALSPTVVEFNNTQDWVVVELETPFAYTGGNLVVAIYQEQSAEETLYSSGSRFLTFSSTGMTVYKQSDSQFTLNADNVPDGTGTTTSYRTNTQLCIVSSGPAVVCDKPETVEANDVTAHEATINWTGGSGTYNVEYKKATESDWTFAAKNTNLTTVSLSNLESNTSYGVRVQSVCGENTSQYKSVNFTTLIGLPYAEDFTSHAGWTVWSGQLNADGSATRTSASGWSFTTGNGVFDTHAKSNIYSTNCYKWLVSPAIPMEDNQQLTFYLALTKYSGTLQEVDKSQQQDDRFIVLATLDGGNNWITLREWNNTGSEFVYNDIACAAEGEEVTIDLSNYGEGQTIQIAFYGESTATGGDNNIHVDNMSVAEIPSCLKPTGLHEIAGSATKNSLQIAWTANSGEENWSVQFKPSDDAEAEWNTVDVTDTLYTILGLQPFTAYDIRVAALCTPEGEEPVMTDYCKAIKAKTAAVVPFEQSFNVASLPMEWKRYEIFLEEVENGGAELIPSDAGWIVDDANGIFPEADKHLVLNVAGAECKAWIVSPIIEIDSIGYQLTFDLALTDVNGAPVGHGAQNDHKFVVLISQNGGESWQRLITWDNQGTGLSYDGINSASQTAKYDLSAFAGHNVMVAFYGESTSAEQPANLLHIANVKIAEIPACSPASSLNIIDIEDTSATAVWEFEEDGAAWQYGLIENPAADFVPADADFANDTVDVTVALSNLTPNTDYVFFLRHVCEGGDKSEALVKFFKTFPAPKVAPWTEDFESFAAETVPAEWDNSASTSSTLNTYPERIWGVYEYGGNKMIRMYNYYVSSGIALINSPRIVLPAEEISQLRFDYAHTATCGEFTLKISADNGKTWADLGSYGKTSTGTSYSDPGDFASIEINLDQYTGQTVILQFFSNANYGSGAIFVDNITIQAAPECMKPTGLAISEITSNGATFSWNEETDGGAWEYAIVPAVADTAENEYTPIATNSILFEELSYNTAYVFYLRKVCGEDHSESISMAFKTLNPYEVTIYDGTSTNSYVPIYGTYVDDGTTSQFIIPADSLLPILWDTITNLTFYSSTASVDWGNAVFEIYMAEAPATTLTEMMPWANMTKVMNAAALSIADNKMEITLDVPYQHHGGNLLIGFNQTVTGTYKSAPWYGKTVSGASMSSYGTYSPVARNFIPKMSIGFREGEAPACATPIDFKLVADSLVTANSAAVTWVPQSEEESWAIRYRVEGAEEWADTLYVLNDTAIIEGLNPATVYEAQVATWCDPEDAANVGDFGASIYFATECVPAATVNEDFENSVLCWNIIPEVYANQGNTYYYPTIAADADKATSGTNFLYFLSRSAGTPADQYAILPELISLEGMRIKFNARKEDDTDENTEFYVGIMTDPTADSTFVVLDTFPLNSTTYAPIVVPFTEYNGEGKYVAIMMPAATEEYASLIIDDVVVEAIPSCLEPANLHADSLMANAVILGWTPQGNESDWLVRYKKNGAAEWADTIHVTEASLLIEGLTMGTAYEAQIAAWCNPSDAEAVSPFSGSHIFTTACGAISIINDGNYVEGFEEYAAAAYNSTAGVAPRCWDVYADNTNGVMPHVIGQGAGTSYIYIHEGTKALTFYGKGYCYAYLPEFAEPLNTLQIKFWMQTESATSGTLKLGYVTAESDIFHEIASYANNNGSMVQRETLLSAVPDSAARLVFQWYYSSQYSCCIDDIEVSLLPSCVKPTGLAISDITSSGATASWDNEEGASWKYAVALADEEAPAIESFIAVADSFVAVSGLAENSNYIFYLVKDCGGAVSESLSATFQTTLGIASVPYVDNFEDGNNWMLINGSLTNAWVYGEAAHNGEGTHALYISNDGGASNAYTNNSAAVVYAVKPFYFEEGIYDFQYDWRANGEGNYDYIRVALVPSDVTLTPATSLPSGVTTTALPENWIALDGGSKLNLQSDWQTYVCKQVAIAAGTYNVVFLWRDDTSGGSQTPAAIDNFSIAKITCKGVTELAVSDITASSASISWTAEEEQDAWQIVYSADPSFDIAEATPIDVAATTYAFSGLVADTLYNVYVRANCGEEDGVSAWSQISFRTASACQTPDELAAADITISSAEISWYTYGQAGFNIRYTADSVWTVISNVESPYMLNELAASTSYMVQVQPVCAGEDEWSEALSFKTKYAAPFLETFDASTKPADWSLYNGLLSAVLSGEAELATNTGIWIFGSNNAVFDSHARINIYGTGRKHWLVTPGIYLPADMQLTFDVALTKFSGDAQAVDPTQQLDDKFAVVISTDEGATWTLLREWNNSGSAYVYNDIATTGEEAFINLSAYTGQEVMIAFYGESTVSGGDNNLHVDNVSIDALPSCLKPEALSIQYVGAHSAHIAWESNAAAWQIAIDTIASFNPDESDLIEVSENPYVLDGLAAAHTYYFYLRANCGEEGFSAWSARKSFTTTIACPAPTDLAATLTPGDGSVATLNWKAGDLESAWVVEYSLNANMSDSIVVLASDTTLSLTGLTADTTYYARVKADCGEEDGESLYSAIISFKPTSAYELLLNDGTQTNSSVPIYGQWVDDYTRSQFIIPEADLEEIEWDSITTLTFYASTANVDWGAAEFKVYMAEAPATTLSELADWSTLTEVMSDASLSIVDNKMVVTLSEPYQYQGGNLLIGFYQTVSGTYVSCSWYGKNATGASFGGYGNGNNVAQRNFLPKMTINYAPGVAPACPKARNLAVSDITADGASFTWKAVEGAAWEYAVDLASAEIPAAFTAVPEGENAIAIEGLEELTAYKFYLRRACGEDGESEIVSIAFETLEIAEEISHSYSDDFESATGWKLINGDEANAWVIGSATNNGGENALYISNDGAYAYDDETPSITYASKLFRFLRAGTFTVSFDWKCEGEFNEEDGAIDYMRAALIPADVALTAGVQPQDLAPTVLPAGWAALDHDTALVAEAEWQRISVVAPVPTIGLYRLVFVWINDESDSDGAPAAIDNLLIIHKDNPTDIEGGAGIETKAIKFMKNNQVYILVNGTVYSITGQKVEVK